MNLSKRRQQLLMNLYWTLEERWHYPYRGWRGRVLRWCRRMQGAHPFYPWQLLEWLNDHSEQYCWPNMVIWKMFGAERNSWWITTDQCREDCAKDGACYCGKFMTAEYRAQMNTDHPDNSPF